MRPIAQMRFISRRARGQIIVRAVRDENNRDVEETLAAVIIIVMISVSEPRRQRHSRLRSNRTEA